MNRIRIGPLDIYGCQEARERLEPYIDGELSRDEQRRVHFHLVICRHCAPLFRFEENLDTRIRQNLGTGDVPGELDAKMREVFRLAREHNAPESDN